MPRCARSGDRESTRRRLLVAAPNKKLTSKGWHRDKRADVAIRVLNKQIEVEKVTAGEGYVSLVLRDICIFCGYFSPNARLDAYETDIDRMFTEVRRATKRTVVMGDFNAKSQTWGAPLTDTRGDLLCEWLATLDMTVINDGELPTCVTPNGSSFIDVTATTGDAARLIKEWRVSLEETLSTHRYITYCIMDQEGTERRRVARAPLDLARCEAVLRRRAMGSAEHIRTLDDLTPLLQEVKRVTGRRVGLRRAPHWWTPEIEEACRLCNASRRVVSRANRALEHRREELAESYKAARTRLKTEIRKSKRACWKRLLESLENDIWGDGYKIVTKELRGLTPCEALTPEATARILDELFPNRADSWAPIEEGDSPPNPSFTLQEMQCAIDGLKNKKAPGPDEIPAEMLKIFWRVSPQVLLDVNNALLAGRAFPRECKRARLVLIPKPGKEPGRPGAYRPLSLINAQAKLYEALIKNRLNEIIEQRELISPRQFGFRKGRSTVHAVRAVLQGSRQIQEKWCVFITLDIKNAFNAVSWAKIMEHIRELHLPPYIARLISSYLEERELITRHGTRVISAGVPQGSALGPTLWNMVYDGVQRTNTEAGVELTAYADDLGVLVRENCVRELNRKVGTTLLRIEDWLREHHMELAHSKTEAIVLKGPRKRDEVNVSVGGIRIPLSKSVKYLGIHLDTQGTFGVHARNAIQKTERRIAALSRLLPNVGGPQTLKRRVLLGVVHSTLLYGASLWAPVLRIKRYENMMVSTQRRMLLRVACAYRTVSAAAVQVLTGTLPIQLLVEERKSLEEAQIGERTPAFRKEVRARVMDRWQGMWETETATAEWTRSLIPDVRDWTNCSHRALSYELTQVLTGHGSFRTCTRRIGKEPTDWCWYCGEPYVDTPEHTIMACGRWDEERASLRPTMRDVASVADLVLRMVGRREDWKTAQAFIECIMKKKEGEERERQGRVRQR